MAFNYEERRRQNIADNKRILAEIGLINPFKDLPKISLKKSGIKRKAESELSRKPKRPLLEQNVDHANRGSLIGTRRRSARIQGSDTPSEEELKKQVDQWQEDTDEDRPKRVEPNRPHQYGAIAGVDVGASWLTRVECCRDLIHRPTVAGIHGGPEGAYSIALSGGYDDNIDLGECFTYTGEGGRDLKGTKNNPKNLRTAPQSKDQELTRGNLALSRSVETSQPVRVIRGYKLTSPFAPEEGYRYDGLYSVEKAWNTTGVSGFGVWKFALRRLKEQAPPPWQFAETMKLDNGSDINKDSGTSENNADSIKLIDEPEKDITPETEEEKEEDGEREPDKQVTEGRASDRNEKEASDKCADIDTEIHDNADDQDDMPDAGENENKLSDSKVQKGEDAKDTSENETEIKKEKRRYKD